MTEEKSLTVREVARRCQCSEETVRRWIWSGKLPARKLGNQWFVEANQMGAVSSRPRVAESRVAHGVPRVRKRPVRPIRSNYDRQEALRQAEEDFQFGQMLREKYGPIDVTELIREVREEDE